MNPETANKCYPCGKVETSTEFLLGFEDRKICFKCMLVIVGMTFEEDLCVISATPSVYNVFTQFFNKAVSLFKKSKYQKFLIPMPFQEIINRQSKSDCYINSATLILRKKRHTYFALMHRPFENN